MTTYTDHDTDYTDIKTYHWEHNPEQVRRDTLDCLDAGEDIKDIRACLMRAEWIAKGYQMLQRLALREQEKRECAAFFATRGPGRPEEMQGGKRRNVYLDDASWAKAVELGNGNASEGIRIALAAAPRDCAPL